MLTQNRRRVRWTAAMRLLVTALSLPLLSPACYNPSIKDGGLLCAEAGKSCPDGFKCNLADRHCYAVVTCSVPAVTPICQDPPSAGTTCNPTCQTGCTCGRCNVSGSAAGCFTTVGTVGLGEICTLGKDNCKPGYICLLEASTCGMNVGRCYQHCTTNAQCGTGRNCEIPILDSSNRDTGYKTCSLQAQPCNPVVTTGNGCAIPALGCYLSAAGATFCDCPNRVTPGILGGVCDVYNDCGPGLVCTGSAGSVGLHCRQACTVGATGGCPNGQRCTAIGTMYGYCF
jgi:hypothetical protein